MRAPTFGTLTDQLVDLELSVTQLQKNFLDSAVQRIVISLTESEPLFFRGS
jgi:hypothetical protein